MSIQLAIVSVRKNFGSLWLLALACLMSQLNKLELSVKNNGNMTVPM